MNAANHSAEFRSLGRILTLAAIALALAGPSRLWGQSCTQGIDSLTLNQGSIIALASGPPGVAQGMVKLHCPATFDYYILYIQFYIGGVNIGSQQLGGLGQTDFGFGVSYSQAIPAPLTMTLMAELWPLGIWSGPVSVLVLPSGTPENAANLGVCPSGANCSAGAPINLTNGNTWIQQRDFAVPGLGGGLDLSRVWNSRSPYATPPSLTGMFGYGWRSTYEEMLSGPDSNNNTTYWRADGGGWTNSMLNSYSLISPPNERAQLVQNPVTGVFTITFADGTQRVFNAQNQLAAIIDRNGNQTTLAYDGSNRLTSVTSAGGSTLNFSYNDPNNVMQATTAQDSVGTATVHAATRT